LFERFLEALSTTSANVADQAFALNSREIDEIKAKLANDCERDVMASFRRCVILGHEVSTCAVEWDFDVACAYVQGYVPVVDRNTFAYACCFVVVNLFLISFALILIMPVVLHVFWPLLSYLYHTLRFGRAVTAVEAPKGIPVLRLHPDVVVQDGVVGNYTLPTVDGTKFFIPASGKPSKAMPEALLARSKLDKLEKPPVGCCLLKAPNGMTSNCFRIDNSILTASHCIGENLDDLDEFVLICGDLSLPLKGMAYTIKQVPSLDFVMFDFGSSGKALAFFATLKLRALKRAKAARAGAIIIAAADPSDPSVGLSSLGLIKGHLDGHPGFIRHDASTISGMSGCPVLQKGAVVGVHVGTKNGFNVCIDLFFLDNDRLAQLDGPVAESKGQAETDTDTKQFVHSHREDQIARDMLGGAKLRVQTVVPGADHVFHDRKGNVAPAWADLDLEAYAADTPDEADFHKGEHVPNPQHAAILWTRDEAKLALKGTKSTSAGQRVGESPIPITPAPKPNGPEASSASTLSKKKAKKRSKKKLTKASRASALVASPATTTRA